MEAPVGAIFSNTLKIIPFADCMLLYFLFLRLKLIADVMVHDNDFQCIIANSALYVEINFSQAYLVVMNMVATNILSLPPMSITVLCTYCFVFAGVLTQSGNFNF